MTGSKWMTAKRWRWTASRKWMAVGSRMAGRMGVG